MVRALLCVAMVACASARSPSLADLLQRNVEAEGGRAAIAAKRTMISELHIVEPKFTVDGTYRTDREGRMRIDVFAGGERVYTEAFDGRDGWQLPQGQTVGEAEGPTARAALAHGPLLPGKLTPLIDLPARGVALTLAGRERVEGIDYFVIEVRMPDGFTTHLYLHPTTYLVERQRDVRALHPDVDAKTRNLENTFEDYRSVAGVRRSFRSQQIDLQSHQVLQTTTITSVRFDEPLDPAQFARPE